MNTPRADSLHNLRKTHRLIHTGDSKREILHHTAHTALCAGVGCRAQRAGEPRRAEAKKREEEQVVRDTPGGLGWRRTDQRSAVS